MSEERIDYWKVLNQECPGDEDAFWRSAYRRLKRLEMIKQYPPRLSLEVTRTQYAQEHLSTKVMVNGVKPHLQTDLAAPCPIGMQCMYKYRLINPWVIRDTSEAAGYYTTQGRSLRAV